MQLPDAEGKHPEPALIALPKLATTPEIRLLGSAARRGGEELEALAWPAGYSPACPSCGHLTTGMEEQYARFRGRREPAVVALAQPGGCLVDELAAALPRGATAT